MSISIFERVMPYLDAVPNLAAFPTAAELEADADQLIAQYPELVENIPLGNSAAGDSIRALKIGKGRWKAALIGFPHPHEPAGAAMANLLMRLLVENPNLREELNTTWYFIPCVDPVGVRLNEGWFAVSDQLIEYAKGYYIPAPEDWGEANFPVEYRGHTWDKSLPETRALMKLYDDVRPDWIFSLHGAHFRGHYWILSEYQSGLVEGLPKLADHLNLPLNLGELPSFYCHPMADGFVRFATYAEQYEEQQRRGAFDPGYDPHRGGDPLSYARQRGDPLYIVCEASRFDSPDFANLTDSGQTYAEVLDEVCQINRDLFKWYSDWMAEFGSLLSDTRFSRAVDFFMGSYDSEATTLEKRLRNLKEDRIATRAEVLQSQVFRFYQTTTLGMLCRAVQETENLKPGSLPTAALDAAQLKLNQWHDSFEKAGQYRSVPIRDLIALYLGTALFVASWYTQQNN